MKFPPLKYEGKLPIRDLERRGEPWTPAEDHYLAKLIEESAPAGYKEWCVLARSFHRSGTAVQTRWYILTSALEVNASVIRHAQRAALRKRVRKLLAA